MIPQNLIIFLADDDRDDCIFFKDALEELPVSAHLTIANDGEQLMQKLIEKINELPHVLFLDLNMPRKNGFECLSEIKHSDKLKQIPVIIFSTSFEQDVADLLYKNGAHYYIRKPAEFSQLKKVIDQALRLVTADNLMQPAKENFLLTGD